MLKAIRLDNIGKETFSREYVNTHLLQVLPFSVCYSLHLFQHFLPFSYHFPSNLCLVSSLLHFYFNASSETIELLRLSIREMEGVRQFMEGMMAERNFLPFVIREGYFFYLFFFLSKENLTFPSLLVM